MNYIDVQKMRKQAFWGELGEGISNAFNYGANNAGKAVKAVGSSITNTSNTKPADAFDAAVEQQRRNRSALTGGDPRFEAAFDNAARQRAITAQANRKEDAARYDAFAAEQRAQAQSRAARVNATIARQQRADSINRANAAGAAPKAEPNAAAAARQARINAANQRNALNTGKPTTGSGYMKLPDGRYASISNGNIKPIKNKTAPAANTRQPKPASPMRAAPAAIPQQNQRRTV